MLAAVRDPATALRVADLPARYVGAWNARDATAAVAILAESFTWEDPSVPEPIDTLAAAAAFLERAWVSFPDLQIELVDGPLIGDSRVAQAWHATGTHQGEGVPPGIPGTGRSIDVAGVILLTVDGRGRITAVRTFYDALALAVQLGLTAL
jgi:steroid delta-isomerase-like uncharacterized protein